MNRQKHYLLLGIMIFLSMGCQKEITPVVQTPRSTFTSTPLPVDIEVTLQPSNTPVEVQPDPTSTIMPTISTEQSVITYTVSAGDTLFGIAQEFQISMEDIATLNPSLTPELLMVGQSIFLPAVEQDQTVTPDAASLASSNVEVNGLAYYQTANNTLWVLGEVRNLSSHDVGRLRVHVQVEDQAGELLESKELDVFPRMLLPDQKAPFGYLFTGMNEDSYSVTVDIISRSGEPDTAVKSQDLDIAVSEDTIANQRIEIQGSIRNSGDSILADIQLVAIFYNEDGAVSGYRLTELNGDFPPNGTAEFSLTGLAVAPIDSYYLTGYAREREE